MHKDYIVLQGPQGPQEPLVHKDCRYLLGRRDHKDYRVSEVQLDHGVCRVLQGRRGQRVLQDQRVTHQFMP